MDLFMLIDRGKGGWMDIAIISVREMTDDVHLLAIGGYGELDRVAERIKQEGGYLAGEPEKWLNEIRGK